MTEELKQHSIPERSKDLDGLVVDVQIIIERLQKLSDKLENEDSFDPNILKEAIKKTEADLEQIQGTLAEIAHK